jgi:hypothetical protein
LICPFTFFAGDFILQIVAVAGLACALVVTVPAQTAAEKKPRSGTSKASHSKTRAKASSARPKAPAVAHNKASSKHGKSTAKRG